MIQSNGVIIDTFIALLWLLPQHEFFRKAISIRNGHLLGHYQLYMPDLAFDELDGILRTSFSVHDKTIQELISSLIGIKIKILEPSTEVLTKTYELNQLLDLSICSTYILSYAMLSKCTLITLDRNLLQAHAIYKNIYFLPDMANTFYDL